MDGAVREDHSGTKVAARGVLKPQIGQKCKQPGRDEHEYDACKRSFRRYVGEQVS